tara:strand:+ start:316 stop:561 length:246 start_codon:yes stop_codon:yes gene_type:complete
VLQFIDALFNRGQFIRRFGMVMVFGMDIAVVTVMLYMILKGKQLPDGWLPVVLEVFALNAVYTGLYLRSRHSETKAKIEKG